MNGYDATKLSQLIDGLKLGFKMPNNVPLIYVDSSNHRSTDLLKNVVSDKLQSEREKIRIAGPFSSPPLHASPLGVVPKKENQYRIIHDLSFGGDQSVNYHISKLDATVTYELLENRVSSGMWQRRPYS